MTEKQTSETTGNRFRKKLPTDALVDIVSVDLSVKDLEADNNQEENNLDRFSHERSKELTTTNAYQKDETADSEIVMEKESTGREYLNSGRPFSLGQVDTTPELTIQKGPNEEVLEIPLKSGIIDDINIRKGPEDSSTVVHLPLQKTTRGFADARDSTEFVIQKGPPDTITRYKETTDAVANSLEIQKGPFENSVTDLTEHSTNLDITGSPTSSLFSVVTITEPRTQTSKYATDDPAKLKTINTGDASQQGTS